MSNTAFALSPISARATSPTEADFEAIREAFVETARGRWFLEEYTKRNRNADTALVLDAVARIERTLAAQKELKAEEPQTPPAPDLTETMAAIKAIIAAARDSAEAALSGPLMDEALAPTRKCARVIREIAWGLRESGADGRICSLLDSQVDAINAACDRIPTGGFRDDVLGAFDQAVANINQLTASGETEAESRPQASASAEETPRAANDASDNVVAFSSATAGTTSQAETSPANTPLADATDTHAARAQEATPVVAMEPLTQAPAQTDVTAQADMAAQTDAPEAHMSPPVATEASANIAEADAVSSQIAFETAASQDLTAQASDGIALDESLFDLTTESTVQTNGEAEAGAAAQEAASTDMMEAVAIEAPTDVTVETAVAEEATQQTIPVAEPEIAASEPTPNPHQFIAPGIATDEIAIIPQVVESLEAMADIAIEETTLDEALADQDSGSEVTAVLAQDQLPTDAPQIADMAEEPVEPTIEAAAAPVSEAEPEVTSDAALGTLSEVAPSMTPDEAPSVPTRTPLPDNMLAEAVAQESYSPASMDMSIAVETALASAANHMTSFAASPTPDAITPLVSLGASLIANGIVAKPETPRNDPLAAIRRMSHAERIAFFS
jgi:hypothetical protein